MLVEKDIAASSGFVSTLPSLLSILNTEGGKSTSNRDSNKPPVPPLLVDSVFNYYRDCQTLLKLKPHEKLTSRDTFRLTLPTSFSLYPGSSAHHLGRTLYVAVVDDEVPAGEGGPSEIIRGIALFTRRRDLTQRLLGEE
jgi:hypothetical protein